MASNSKASIEDDASGPSQTTSDVPKRKIPSHLLEKFKALEKRTNEVTKRSTEKRIKHLQKTALESVSRALNAEDREIVQLPAEQCSNDVTEGTTTTTTSGSESDSRPTSITKVRKRPHDDGHTPQGQQEKEGCSDGKQADPESSREEEWRHVRGLMGVNDHLAGVSHGSLGPKTLLQLKMETAIAEGDVQTAEELSDRMATREFGEKVTEAIDARNFLEHKQKEEEMAKAKRKKKLHWGFEAKHRWETKSNM